MVHGGPEIDTKRRFKSQWRH